MKILVAADGSVYTERMLDRLVARDGWFEGSHRYTVMHCVEPLPPRTGAYMDAEARAHFYASESERVFAPIRSFCAAHGLAVTFVSRTGSPAQEIATMAEHDQFDLIVMGSRGHGALGGLLMGSVAMKVVALGNTPVLLVR